MRGGGEGSEHARGWRRPTLKVRAPRRQAVREAFHGTTSGLCRQLSRVQTHLLMKWFFQGSLRTGGGKHGQNVRA